jgi:hypothetical protein
VIRVTGQAAPSDMLNPTQRGAVMNKLFVILALTFALAAGTVIDAVTIAQSAHAACIGTTC